MKEKVLDTKFKSALLITLLTATNTCIADQSSGLLLRSLKTGEYTLIDSNTFSDKSDQVSQFCSSFTLNEIDIKQFFHSAHVITQRKLHDDDRYLTAPCSVKGHLISSGQQFEFDIMASGVARVFSANNGIILECVSRCKQLLTPTTK